MTSRIRTTHTLTLKTYTSSILISQPVGAAMYPTTQPPRAAKVKITVTGTPCVGTIVTTGTLNGVAVTESVSFALAASKVSTKTWDTITSFSITGITSLCTITVNAVDALGQPMTWFESSDDYPCVFSTLSGLNAMLVAKQLGLTSTVLHYVRTEAPIQPGDEFSIYGFSDTFVPASATSIVTIAGTDDILEYEIYCVKR